ncbi:MAG: nif-specific transcriptional activator NifA [Pseudomonadales bacterium]|nr:nif-specific transcriptional activator NifA [Pseudomonadales bacterium]
MASSDPIDLVTSRRDMLERELDAIYKVSKVLGKSFDLNKTMSEVLQILNDDMGLSRGIVSISDKDNSEVKVSAVQGDIDWLKKQASGVMYKSGEGIIGRILASGESIVLGRISSEPNFTHKMDIYEMDLPFIGVAIKGAEDSTIGILAAQPDVPADEYLSERTRFMQMVANLIAQNLQLATKVATKQKDLVEERDELRREVRKNYSFDQMAVGHSESMRMVFEQVRRVAKWDSTVLIRGESGTGKELIAGAIHYNSPRSNKSFVKLNCAALPENLLESELFGHEKGAFTGAIKQRQGRFEQADGGTLFLDEIGEISPMFQAKLLRVLQENELERVGGNQTIKVNVRIVAATNRNLESEVEEGNFREDLYYRLNVMPINLPPLRDRLVDLPELADFLVNKIGKQQKRELRITDGAIRRLMGYHWPGNVRELENCLERASVMCEQDSIDLDAISLTGIEQSPLVAPQPNTPKIDLNDQNLDERERVTAALEQAGWVQARAARLLGMTPRQIAYRIQTLNINMRKI